MRRQRRAGYELAYLLTAILKQPQPCLKYLREIAGLPGQFDYTSTAP